MKRETMKISKTLCAASFIALLAGCASMSETVSPTPQVLQDKTAGNLGFPPKDVKISDVREATGLTYFVATTPKGAYGCSIPSGGMTGFATLGMVNLQPTCTKQ